MSTPVHNDLDFQNQSKIENLPDPTAAQDAATKAYVDSIAAAGGATKQGTDGRTYNLEAVAANGFAPGTTGEYSVDLQLDRTSAVQIASGNNSGLFAGESNRASGSHAVCLGGLALDATGSYSGAVGGNSLDVTGTRAFGGGGSVNDVTGLDSGNVGGASNIISGARSSGAGGTGVVVSGGRAGSVGCLDSIVSGDQGFAAAAKNGQAKAECSQISGRSAFVSDFLFVPGLTYSPNLQYSARSVGCPGNVSDGGSGTLDGQAHQLEIVASIEGPGFEGTNWQHEFVLNMSKFVEGGRSCIAAYRGHLTAVTATERYLSFDHAGFEVSGYVMYRKTTNDFSLSTSLRQHNDDLLYRSDTTFDCSTGVRTSDNALLFSLTAPKFTQAPNTLSSNTRWLLNLTLNINAIPDLIGGGGSGSGSGS